MIKNAKVPAGLAAAAAGVDDDDDDDARDLGNFFGFFFFHVFFAFIFRKPLRHFSPGAVITAGLFLFIQRGRRPSVPSRWPPPPRIIIRVVVPYVSVTDPPQPPVFDVIFSPPRVKYANIGTTRFPFFFLPRIKN